MSFSLDALIIRHFDNTLGNQLSLEPKWPLWSGLWDELGNYLGHIKEVIDGELEGLYGE